MTDSFYNQLKQILLKYDKFLITTHIVPDADGLGSQISLCTALRKLGKQSYCVNEEALMERYKYLDPQNTIISLEGLQKNHPDFKPQLIIIVDTNKVSRTGLKMSQYLTAFAHIIYIDHHPCGNLRLGTHFVNTKAAATAEIIGELIKRFQISFTEDIALALYTAILIDTNTFRYPTVTAKTHQLIAELLETGVKITKAYNHINGEKKLQQMHLLGHILKNCKTTEDGYLAWIRITREEFEQYDSEIEDTHAYINNLLVLENVKVACMFREDDRRIKLSLRSHGEIDVGEIAQELGGGGHNHSAATNFEVPPHFDRDEIINNSLLKISRFIEGKTT